MTDLLDAEDAAVGPVEPSEDELALARQLVRQAKEQGARMSAPGLMRALTKCVLETALDEELADYLGYDKHEAVGRNGGNSRNGTRSKTVITDAVGPLTIDVSRDREGTFEPVILRKHQRWLEQVDQIVVSLLARGLTTGEVVAHSRRSMGPRCPRTPSPGLRTRSPRRCRHG